MAFTCQVCFECGDERLALGQLATGNGDVLRADDCDHPICQACLATWVSTRVQEQFVFNICCPFVGCTNKLFEQDVARLVQAGALEKGISERFIELRTRDYTERAKVLSQTLTDVLENEKDFDVIRSLWQSTRLCPRCSLAIERSEGCNSFYCICGHHFDYSSAPRIFGNNIKSYDKVIDVAKSLGISLAEAEQYGLDPVELRKWSSVRAFATHKAVTRISGDTNVSMGEALELYSQARSGDIVAQSRIRETRGRVATLSSSEEEEDEVTYAIHWESATEKYDDLSQEMGNMTQVMCVTEVNENNVSNSTGAIVQQEEEESVVFPQCPPVHFGRWCRQEADAYKQKKGCAILLRRSVSQP